MLCAARRVLVTGTCPYWLLCVGLQFRRLAGAEQPPEDAYLIVQEEAAKRFAGTPYAPETLQALLLKPWWRVEIARRLKRSDFEPPPSVDCALLWMARRPRPLVEPSERDLYRDFVAAAFGRHAGTVHGELRRLLTRRQIRRLARDLRFDANTPPSALSFDQWLAVFRFFALAGRAAARAHIRGALGRLPRRGYRWRYSFSTPSRRPSMMWLRPDSIPIQVVAGSSGVWAVRVDTLNPADIMGT